MKKLVSAKEIKEAAEKGEKIFCLDCQTIITPAAKDLAKDLGVEFSYGANKEEYPNKAEIGLKQQENPKNDLSGDLIYQVVKAVLDQGATNHLGANQAIIGKEETKMDAGILPAEKECISGNFDYDLESVQEARDLARQAKQAQAVLAKFDAGQIDRIIQNMVKKAEENAVSLAKMAVEETGFGKVEDKVFKNRFASTDLYKYIRPMQTVGLIKDDQINKIVEIAEPVGLLMGIIPSTNPTSTVIYKSIIAIKSRNAIVFSPHPSALKCTLQAARLMHEAAVAAGAPPRVIGCIAKPSSTATNELMKSDEVDLIIATGGAAMVKAAYSAGKPALGVGPGNVPAFIERTANIPQAVKNIILSKTFDNGTICASEQAVIVEDCIKSQVVEEFRRQGGYFMSPEETSKVAKKLFVSEHVMNPKMVGRSAAVIADNTGITIPPGTKVLLGEQKGVGPDYPLSYEKLTTVLAFYTAKDWQEACDLCIKLLQNGGIGHTLSIHTEDQNMALKFAEKPVFRILVNTPSAHGAVGASTGLAPSLTLGCGTWGGSSTSDNVTPMHLINIKRVAYGIKDLAGNAAPSQLVIGANAISPGAIREDILLNIVNEVVSLLKKG